MPLDEFARQILTASGGAARRPGQRLLRHQQGHQRHARAGHAGLLRRAHALRPLPHAPVRELDAGRLLRPGQLLQPGERASRTRPLSRRDRRRSWSSSTSTAGNADQSAHRPAAAAALPRRRASRSSTPATDRREAYAHWLDRRRRTRSSPAAWPIAIWSYFFHRGIIDPVDDIRSTNPPINPAAARRPDARTSSPTSSTSAT